MKTRKKIFVKRKVAVQPFIILLVMILTIICILLFMFFEYSKAEQEKDDNRFVGFESSNSESNGLIGSTENEAVHGSAGDVIENANAIPNNSSDSENSIENAQNQLSEGSDNQENDAFKVETLVPKTIPVNDDYFEDALFIGDSILKGFKSFAATHPDNVIAELNAGLDQIFLNKDVYYTSPTIQTTLWKAIDEVLPEAEKIYVLLGTNGIPGYENEKSIGFYEDLLVKLKEKFPDKVIYISAVTPITAELSEERAPDFTTEKLNDFNNRLFELCQAQGVYFLQTDEDLKDSNGNLNSDYDAGDGMHLNKAGHTKLLEYFKTHIVSADGISQKVS